MKKIKTINFIKNWLLDYSIKSKTEGFVIGVSGGIDSALTSTLCAMTKKKVICASLPIKKNKTQIELSQNHISWLKNKYPQVEEIKIDLTKTYETLNFALPLKKNNNLSLANLKSRLRMVSLYFLASSNNLLVAGTGNKVEDFGIGFYTKYGDGGVDISPIADLTKTEVYKLAKELKIIKTIQDSVPTDGLWDDFRTDEDQIGASYKEIEKIMEYVNKNSKRKLNKREQEVLSIYKNFHSKNLHKMNPIPVCEIPNNLR